MNQQKNFDLAAELIRITKLGLSPNIIYDDNGYFAVVDESISHVRNNNEDFTITHIVNASWFKPTPQEAWELYLRRMMGLSIEL